jgi:hypothetical protein
VSCGGVSCSVGKSSGIAVLAATVWLQAQVGTVKRMPLLEPFHQCVQTLKSGLGLSYFADGPTRLAIDWVELKMEQYCWYAGKSSLSTTVFRTTIPRGTPAPYPGRASDKVWITDNIFKEGEGGAVV